MKKIKERNFAIKNESNQILIRSIKNIDLEYYRNWFKDGHILKEVVDTLSEEEIDRWILRDTKKNYTFIIEYNEKPYGEIVLWNDTSLIITDKYYKKPYFSIMVKFYENINDNDVNDILKFFLESIHKIKIKIGLLYAFIDEKDEQNYKDNYLLNGFKYLKKELCKTKLEKFFEKTDIENPYKKLGILIKNV